jgi:hypothetical protein
MLRISIINKYIIFIYIDGDGGNICSDLIIIFNNASIESKIYRDKICLKIRLNCIY